jgi:hypothetical protein
MPLLGVQQCLANVRKPYLLPPPKGRGGTFESSRVRQLTQAIAAFNSFVSKGNHVPIPSTVQGPTPQPPLAPPPGAVGEAPLELVPGSVPVTGFVGVDAAGEASGVGVVTLGSLALVPMSHAASPRTKQAEEKTFSIVDVFIDQLRVFVFSSVDGQRRNCNMWRRRNDARSRQCISRRSSELADVALELAQSALVQSMSEQR